LLPPEQQQQRAQQMLEEHKAAQEMQHRQLQDFQQQSQEKLPLHQQQLLRQQKQQQPQIQPLQKIQPMTRPPLDQQQQQTHSKPQPLPQNFVVARTPPVQLQAMRPTSAHTDALSVSERGCQALKQVEGQVGQAMKQQEMAGMAQQKKLFDQVHVLDEVLNVQMIGLGQMFDHISTLESAAAHQVQVDPSLKDKFTAAKSTQFSLRNLTQAFQEQLGQLQQAQKDSQEAYLRLTQTQMKGLHNIAQNQTMQLDGTQAKVENLEKFAMAAQRQGSNIAESHEKDMETTQSHLMELQGRFVEQQRELQVLEQQARDSADEEWAGDESPQALALLPSNPQPPTGEVDTLGGDAPLPLTEQNVLAVSMKPKRQQSFSNDQFHMSSAEVQARIEQVALELCQLVRLGPESDECIGACQEDWC